MKIKYLLRQTTTRTIRVYVLVFWSWATDGRGCARLDLHWWRAQTHTKRSPVHASFAFYFPLSVKGCHERGIKRFLGIVWFHSSNHVTMELEVGVLLPLCHSYFHLVSHVIHVVDRSIRSRWGMRLMKATAAANHPDSTSVGCGGKSTTPRYVFQIKPCVHYILVWHKCIECKNTGLEDRFIPIQLSSEFVSRCFYESKHTHEICCYTTQSKRHRWLIKLFRK